MQPDQDRQLNELLHEWEAPVHAPASLAARLDRARRPLWKRLLTYSIPVPLPVAAALLALVLYGGLRLEEMRRSTAGPAPLVCAGTVASAAVRCANC